MFLHFAACSHLYFLSPSKSKKIRESIRDDKERKGKKPFMRETRKEI
jgi:hypothetical protein